MLFRKMPKVKEDLSILGFGCMRFPILDNDGSKIDEEKAIKMLRYAIDNGVNYIDTAYPYHGKGMGEAGSSEPLVAKALQNGYRKKVYIATKLPSWLITTREDMDMFLNKQLKRLQTDHIDFYLIHTLNVALWAVLKPLDFAEFLDNAKKEGKIRYAGFSFHDDSIKLFKEIVDAYDWDFCQVQYNYMDENYQAGIEGLEYAVDKGLGIVIMEPLKGGSLVNFIPEEANDTFKAANKDRTAVSWALKWIWNNKDVAVVLSGMSDMQQIEENIQIASNSAANSMTEAELETIKEVKDIIRSKVKVDCTACKYCMPCPHGVNIPQCFAYYNDFFRFDSLKAKGNAKIMYNSILSKQQKASSCVECGKCEEHCPQGIQIINELKNVSASFGS